MKGFDKYMNASIKVAVLEICLKELAWVFESLKICWKIRCYFVYINFLKTVARAFKNFKLVHFPHDNTLFSPVITFWIIKLNRVARPIEKLFSRINISTKILVVTKVHCLANCLYKRVLERTCWCNGGEY